MKTAEELEEEVGRSFARLLDDRRMAREKAIDALGRYKFAMFGYWAGIWVHLNRIIGDKEPNPFAHLVKAAREGIP